MLRILIRTFAVIALAGAFAAFVIDGTRSIAAGALLLTSFGTTFLALFPKVYDQLQPTIVHHIHPLLWDPVLVRVLSLPTWAVLAPVALVLLWLARGRKAKIGYSSRP